MQSPWHGKSGLEKAAAILATILSIALGLCGMNYGAVFFLNVHRLSNGWTAVGNALAFTAFAELAVMLLSFAGLVLVMLIYVGKWIAESFSKGPKGGG
jgi:hypothetical protein